MIDSTKDVPKVLLESRDCQVFLRLLNLITVSKKSYIDNMIKFLDPMQCPSKYLPLLASYVGYKYDDTLEYRANRIIIKYYPHLIRNRGTEYGIKLAVAVAISASNYETEIGSAMELVNVVYNDSTASVYIYYPNYIQKVNDLIEIVRPIGVGTVIYQSLPIGSHDEIDVADIIKIHYDNYKREERSSIISGNETFTPNAIVGLGHNELDSKNDATHEGLPVDIEIEYEEDNN